MLCSLGDSEKGSVHDIGVKYDEDDEDDNDGNDGASCAIALTLGGARSPTSGERGGLFSLSLLPFVSPEILDTLMPSWVGLTVALGVSVGDLICRKVCRTQDSRRPARLAHGSSGAA